MGVQVIELVLLSAAKGGNTKSDGVLLLALICCASETRGGAGIPMPYSASVGGYPGPSLGAASYSMLVVRTLEV